MAVAIAFVAQPVTGLVTLTGLSIPDREKATISFFSVGRVCAGLAVLISVVVPGLLTTDLSSALVPDSRAGGTIMAPTDRRPRRPLGSPDGAANMSDGLPEK